MIKKHAYAIRREKIKLCRRKRNSKMTRKYSNQTYVQESLKNKNFMYKLQKEIDP